MQKKVNSKIVFSLSSLIDTFICISQAFQTLPDSLDEIDSAIHDEQARLQCQYETNPEVS